MDTSLLIPTLDLNKESDLYYLAGLMEPLLRVRFRYDRCKLVSQIVSTSWYAKHVIQKHLGGIVCSGKGKELAFSSRQMYTIAKRFLPLSTSLRDLYQSIIDLVDYKTNINHSAVSSHNEEYKQAYKKGLDNHKQKVLANRERKLPIDNPSYLTGSHDINKVFTIEQIEQIKSLIVYAKSNQAIEEENKVRQTNRVMNQIAAEERRIVERDRRRIERKRQRAATYEQYKKERHTRSIERLRVKKEQQEARKAARTLARQQKKQRVLDNIANGVKTCGHCEETLSLDHFNKNRCVVGGYGVYCKRCSHERYYQPNKALFDARSRQWQKDNPEKTKAMGRKESRKPHNLLRKHIRTRIKAFLNETLPTNKHIDYVGCSITDLRNYIETLFAPDMTWANYGGTKGWCIDHIIPHTSFNHNNDTHLHWCWNYRNLRPMWYAENSSKSDQIGGFSVRQLRKQQRYHELHDLVGQGLQDIGITTKNDYLASL